MSTVAPVSSAKVAQRVAQAIGPAQRPLVRSQSDGVLKTTVSSGSESGLFKNFLSKSASASDLANASDSPWPTQQIANRPSANRAAAQSDVPASSPHLDQDRDDSLNAQIGDDLQERESPQAINRGEAFTLVNNASSTQMGEEIVDELEFDADISRPPPIPPKTLISLTNSSDEIVQRVVKAAGPALQPADSSPQEPFIAKTSRDLSQEQNSSPPSSGALDHSVVIEPSSILMAKQIKVEHSIDDKKGQSSSSTALFPHFERSDLFDSETTVDQRDRERAQLLTSIEDADSSDAFRSSNAADELREELVFDVDPENRADVDPSSSFVFSFSSQADEVAQRLNQVISTSQVLENFIAQMTNAEDPQDQQPLDAPLSGLANSPQVELRQIQNVSHIVIDRADGNTFEQMYSLPRFSDFNLQRSDLDGEQYDVDPRDQTKIDLPLLDQTPAPIDSTNFPRAEEALAENQNLAAPISDASIPSSELILPLTSVSVIRVAQSVDETANPAFQMSRSQTAESITEETPDREISQKPARLSLSRNSPKSDLPIGPSFNRAAHSARRIKAKSPIDFDNGQLNIPESLADDQRVSSNINDRSLGEDLRGQRQEMARSTKTVGTGLENEISSAHEEKEHSDELGENASFAISQNALESSSTSGPVPAKAVANRVDEAINAPSSPLVRSAPLGPSSAENLSTQPHELFRAIMPKNTSVSVESSDLEIDDLIEVEMPDSKAGPSSSGSLYYPPTMAGRIDSLLNQCVEASKLKRYFGILDGTSQTEKLKGGESDEQKKNGIEKDKFAKETAEYLIDQFPILYKMLKKEDLSHKSDSDLWTSVMLEMRKGLNATWFPETQIFKSLNYYLFGGLTLLPFAKKTLESEFQLDPNMNLAAQLRHTANLIENVTIYQKAWKDPIKVATTQMRKFSSKFNYMDAQLYNASSLTGLMLTQSKSNPDDLWGCYQLRHPTPTVEYFRTIEVTPEYAAFVSEAGQKGHKILYSNHQCSGRDESRRVDELKAFEQKNSNFFLISLPVLNNVDDPSIHNKQTFCDFLETLISNRDLRAENGFYFSEKSNFESSKSDLNQSREISDEFIENRTRVWVNFFKDHLIEEKEIIPNLECQTKQDLIDEKNRIKSNRVMYLTLLQSFLRRDIIQECKMTFCNNTCKDGIDRGAIHLFFDIYWSILMNGEEDDSQARENLNISTFFPAYFAKEQAVLPKRFDIIMAFANKIGCLDCDSKQRLRSAWQSASLVLGTKFRFADGDENIHSNFDWDSGSSTSWINQNDASGKNRANWNQLAVDLARGMRSPNSVRCFGQDLVTIHINDPKNRQIITGENYRTLSIAQAFYKVFNPLRAQGGILANCSDDLFESRLSQLALLLSQATGVPLNAFGNACNYQCHPGYMLANFETTNQRQWDLSWKSETSCKTMRLEATIPFYLANSETTEAKSDQYVLGQASAEIDTQEFFTSIDAPVFPINYSLLKQPLFNKVMD